MLVKYQCVVFEIYFNLLIHLCKKHVIYVVSDILLHLFDTLDKLNYDVIKISKYKFRRF